MKKARYIFDYYKLPIAIVLILLYIAGYAVHRHFTRKDVILYAALVNVSVSPELEADLSEGFLESLPARTDDETMLLHTGFYLTDRPDADSVSYTRASQMKILAGIDARQLDLVIMDKEAFDAFAQNGYLYNLDELFRNSEDVPEGDTPAPADSGDSGPAAEGAEGGSLTAANEGGSSPAAEGAKGGSLISRELAEKVRGHLVVNMEIIEDNAKEIALDPSVEYQSTIDEYSMGIDLSEFPLIRDARFSEPVYLGIIRNTPRIENVIRYLSYLSE